MIKTVRGEGYVLSVPVKRRRPDAGPGEMAAAVAVRPPDAGVGRRLLPPNCSAQPSTWPNADRLLLTASGRQQAQRIADVVKLLDTSGRRSANASLRC